MGDHAYETRNKDGKQNDDEMAWHDKLLKRNGAKRWVSPAEIGVTLAIDVDKKDADVERRAEVRKLTKEFLKSVEDESDQKALKKKTLKEREKLIKMLARFRDLRHYKRKGHFQWVLGWPAKSFALPGDPAKPDGCAEDAFLLLNAEDIRVYDALGSITKYAENKFVPEERANRKSYAANKAAMPDALIGGFKFGALDKGNCWLSDASAVLRWRAQEAKKKRENKKAEGGKGGGGKRKAEASEDEEDEEAASSEGEADSEEEEKPKKKSKLEPEAEKKTKKESVKKKKVEYSSEGEEEEKPTKKKADTPPAEKKKKSKAESEEEAVKKKKVVESSSEEEEEEKPTKKEKKKPASTTTEPKYLNDSIVDVPVNTAEQQTRVFSHIICRKRLTNPIWAKGSSMIAPELPKSGFLSDNYPVVTDSSKFDTSFRLALAVAVGKPDGIPRDRNDVVKLREKSRRIIPAVTDDELQMLAAENYRQMLETRVKAITAARSSLDQVDKKTIAAIQEKELEEGSDSSSSSAAESEEVQKEEVKPAEKDIETSNSDEEAAPVPTPPTKLNLSEEVEKITGKRFEAIEKRFDNMAKTSDARSARIEAMLEKLMEEKASSKTTKKRESSSAAEASKEAPTPPPAKKERKEEEKKKKEEEKPSAKRPAPAGAATVTVPAEKKVKAVVAPKVF